MPGTWNTYCNVIMQIKLGQQKPLQNTSYDFKLRAVALHTTNDFLNKKIYIKLQEETYWDVP